jgi:hypothetical protein
MRVVLEKPEIVPQRYALGEALRTGCNPVGKDQILLVRFRQYEYAASGVLHDRPRGLDERRHARYYEELVYGAY